MRYVLVFLFVSCSLFSFSQETEKEQLIVHKIGGKEYYIHVVDTGNTLFAISRKYAIPREEILKANPRLTDILTLGDRLMIPLDKITRRDLDEAPDIDGNFLIHEVQKKNTLYSIAKEYNVEINDIIVANPEIEEGLKKGAKIKIPVAKIKSSTGEEEYVVPAAASPYVTHKVAPKETLYSLSKLYNVSIDSINMVNNGLVGGLKENDLINIPILKNYKKMAVQAIEDVEFDSSAVKRSYKVSVLLPFYLDLMDSSNGLGYRQSQEVSKDLFNKAQYAIDFYQGFKLAAQEKANKGLNLELQVFDTGKDSSTVMEIINSNELDGSDLLVGPLFLSNFLQVADYAKRNKINIVSPVKLSNKVLLGNSYVSKVATSEPIQTRFLGQYIYDSLRFSNLIVVYPDKFQDRKRMEVLKKQIKTAAEVNHDTTRMSPLREVFWNPKDLYGIKSKLKEDELNVIVAPSSDQSFVTRLLTSLNMMGDFKFKVVGLEAWKNFENIEIEYLHNLNVHLITSEFIDADHPENVEFIKKFNDTYETMPSEFAYLGYDVASYYLDLLQVSGTNFEMMLPTEKMQGLSRKFYFVKTGIESGFENHSSYILRYQDYKLVKVQ
ncbi:MAG: LysM repeat protein/ABC-type branched-subunit amino acid transport system substrate-binding protein [Vicingaceae bacterium]|jgi:LysM repeat protein/ABC-type branched-subunit amino acid transport system substrate-binding protein